MILWEISFTEYYFFIKRYYNYKVPIPKEINQEAEELLNKRIRLVDEVDEQ